MNILRYIRLDCGPSNTKVAFERLGLHRRFLKHTYTPGKASLARLNTCLNRRSHDVRVNEVMLGTRWMVVEIIL